MPTPIHAVGASKASKKSSLRRGSLFRRGLTVFPALVIPMVIYLIMVIFAGGRADPDLPAMTASLNAVVLDVPMISGVDWRLRAGELLLFLGLGMLAIEIAKATSSKSGSIANHAVSMGLLLVCFILFLIVPAFATSTFFLLTMMVLFDVLAGAMVTIISARRDFGVGDGFAG